MKQAFSKINTFLVFFNLGIMLGIGYLWYPTFQQETSYTREPIIKEREVRNQKLEIGDNDQVQATSTEQDAVVSISTSTDTQDTKNSPELVSLPTTVNLDVPFTSQAPESNWEQPWQDACEEAAILMLDAYYKGYALSPLFSKDELLKMVDWQTERGWGYSIPLSQIEQASRDYMGDRFDFRVIEDPSIEELKRLLAEGTPIYVVAYGKSLDNPNFTNGGPEYHALIIRGYNESGFITNDPGTRNGKEFFYTYENLMSSMHDWNNGDVENGDVVVMVVERL